MKLKYIFLVLSIISLVIGLTGMFMGHGKSSTPDMVQGIFKGFAGVFFILYFVLVLFGNQPIDKSGGDHW